MNNVSMKADEDAAFEVQRGHVSGLSPFTNYTFVVRAGNTLDDVMAWGNWSNVTSVVTDTARKLQRF